MIHEQGGLQVIDFGVAGVMESKFDKRGTIIGTPNWMPPEQHRGMSSKTAELKYGFEVSNLNPSGLQSIRIDRMHRLTSGHISLQYTRSLLELLPMRKCHLAVSLRHFARGHRGYQRQITLKNFLNLSNSLRR